MTFARPSVWLVVLGAWPSISFAAPRAGNPRAEALAKGDAWAMADRCDQATPFYRKALGGTGEREAHVRARLAACLLSGKDGGSDPVAEARSVADEGLAAMRSPELLMVAGDVALRQKDLPRALAFYIEAGKTPSRRREAGRARLEVMALLGESDAEYKRSAIELARAIVDDNGESDAGRARAEELLVGLRFGAAGKDMLTARAKLAEGDGKAVIALLEPRVAANPALEDAYYFLGVAYDMPGVGRHKEALLAYEHAPKVREAQLALGVAALESGDLDASATALKAAIALDAKYQPAYYYLGLLEKERGDNREAQTAFGRAMASGPSTPIGKLAASKLALMNGQASALVEGQVVDAAQEVALGQAIAAQVSAHFGAYTDEPLRTRLEVILHRLAAVADRPERELRYRIQLVDVPVPNAITLPGGTILVFRGLADMIKKDLGDRDDAWAAVLGHECAHAALRHGVGMMSMAGSLTGAHAFEGGIGDLNALMNTISRAHEFEANQFGALYAYRAGFSPADAIRLHEVMLKNMGEIPRGMTHPMHAERIAGLEDYLIELRGKVRGFDLAVKSLNDGDLDAARVRLEIFLGVFPDSLSARSNLGVALHRRATQGLAPVAELRRVTDIDPESHARKIELRSTDTTPPKLDRAMLQSAVAEYRSALSIDPSYAYALTNLGAALFDLGDKKAARLTLDRAVARAPRAPEAWINRASVLEADGQLAGAQADLRRALVLDEKSAVAWFDLALVSEKMGRKDDAKGAWDRFLVLDGKSGWAEVARQHRGKL